MSWSNSWVGRRTGIKAALAQYGQSLSGDSQEEFESARPHLEGLLDLNSATDGDPVLRLEASGHAYRVAVSGYSNVSVDLKPLGKLCEDPAPALATEG